MKKKVSKVSKSTKSKSDSRLNGNSESGDIVTLILRDHKPIKELLLVLKDSDVEIAEKRPAFDEFQRILRGHTKAEEESLYVQLKQDDETKVEALEGDTEHALAEQLMNEVDASTGDENLWMAKVKVLAELVEHHLKEEEKEVLKQVRQDLSSEQRAKVGAVYSRLLLKYQDENGESKKFIRKEEMRADHV
ncbi:MAG: hemerythrin domain-containing protein [Bdellovibrionales bacterium]|nr:hemerythrin domain-containing protein [Bdellovibrionales bacterium]